MKKAVPADLDMDLFELVEGELVVTAIIELGGAGRGMGGHDRCLFEDAAIFEIGGDARRPEGVVVDPSGDAGGLGSAVDHHPSIAVGKRRAAQGLGAPINRRKQRSFGAGLEPSDGKVVGEIAVQCMVAGDVMDLAAFLHEAHPEPVVPAGDVLDLERQGCADAGKGEGHQRDQGAIAEAGGLGLDLP